MNRIDFRGDILKNYVLFIIPVHINLRNHIFFQAWVFWSAIPFAVEVKEKNNFFSVPSICTKKSLLVERKERMMKYKTIQLEKRRCV